ncbi:MULTISPECIES: ester cyclase [unclassified Minwuia]|jgi:predicted ester cyclase|uniref:ester cyclase n=1 Tax=unclassified Minwuia TaxID=2618799 RepID=UPI0024789131|nr:MULTISPECIES: ester cyclase [unclassified Minwuia]
MTSTPQRTPRQVMEAYLMEVVTNGRLDLIEELAQPDMVDEANQAFNGPPGRAGLVAHAKGFGRNISDLSVTVDQIVAGEDDVMAKWTFTGKLNGPWLGQTPTGKIFSCTAFSFFRLRDGLIDHYRVWLHANLDTPVVFDSANPQALLAKG